jgi:hypothetical protein
LQAQQESFESGAVTGSHLVADHVVNVDAVRFEKAAQRRCVIRGGLFIEALADHLALLIVEEGLVSKLSHGSSPSPRLRWFGRLRVK